MNWIRHIAAWTLLAAYLPMVVLSSLHVHHDTIDDHDYCVQCAGHFESQHNHDSDCQYCHFLNLSYLRQESEPLPVLFPVTDKRPSVIADRAEKTHHGVSQLRAPPIC